MPIRTIVVLLLSLICGVSAAFGVNRFMTRDAAPAEVKTTPVIVANVDVARATPLRSELLRVQQWPEALVPAGVLRDMEHAVGLATLTPLVAGELILESKVADSGVGAAALVRPGMRAFTIETPTSSSGVAGFLQPENRVDILLTVSDFDLTGPGVGGGTWTLLQNVEILAAGERLDQTNPKLSGQRMANVTLLVTPDMAAKLTLASTMGTLNLTLRNDADVATAETQPVTMRELMFLQEAVAVSDDNAEEESVELVEPIIPPPAPIANPPAAPREILALRGTTPGSIIRVVGARTVSVPQPLE